MPPKSPKGGKKKLSKAEKERLKKEDAEKKAQEEEEARLLAEKDEAEKKELEKHEAEERRRLENEERKKRKGQLQELEALWESYRTTLNNEYAERRKNSKWTRYMLCDGSPDPTNAGEINTFMNLWREDKGDMDIENVLTSSKLPLRLIAEVEFLLHDTPEEELPEIEAQAYRQTITELQSLLSEKLDHASHDLSLKSSKMADSETMNLQQVIGNDIITLCMWGNLSKNPRIKSFEFPDQGFQFELPKLLTLSDIGVRLLKTKYDHLSQHCKTYKPRIKKPEEITPVEEEVPKEPTQVTEGEEGAKEGEGEGEGDVSREQTQDVMAALQELEDGNEDEDGEKEEKEEEPPADEEPLEEDYEIKTPEPPEFEEFDGDDDILDLRAYQVVGGVFHFNLIHLPPQPKQVNDWVITQVLNPPTLRHFEYVADIVTAATPAPEVKDDTEKKSEGSAPPKRDVEKPPIGVTLHLPKDVYFCEEPQVVRWDADTKEWKLDGFTDHKFTEDARTLYFKTAYYGTMALVQDTHINMPFQSWELRPKAANHSVMTIIAAIVEVEIEIKDDKVCLVQPESKSELQHLINQWMSVADFIKKMQSSGVNIFPTEDSSKYVSIQNKNSITEDRLYQQMSMVSSAMAFSWSKWNSEIHSADKIILQGAEHLADEPLLEEEWSMFMVTKKRTTKLKMIEFDENFSEDHADGTEFHADLYHMVMDITGEDAKQKIRDTNYKYINSIYEMLKSTRCVTYS